MKINKINPKTFEKEVTTYHNKIFYTNRGKGIIIAASKVNLELTIEQVAYVHAVMVVCDKDLIDFGMAYVEIPVGLLFTLMTPFSVECYEAKGRTVMNYMAEVTTRCIEALRDIVIYRNKSEGQCRKFGLVKEFVDNYYKAQQDIMFNNSNITDLGTSNIVYTNRFLKGVGFKYMNRVHELTIKAVDKARDSRFRFDVDTYNSKEGKEFITEHLRNPKTGKVNNLALDSLNSCLNFIGHIREPQYHTEFHLQHSGRVHTIGGCIQMPKWFRHKFILPVNPNNVRMEVDLKCAQLLIICEILNDIDLRETLLELIEEKGSIWDEIGDKKLDKRVKKIILYSFCFGAELKHIPFLASREVKRLGIDVSVDKSLVDSCLGGLLQSLRKKREDWLNNFQMSNVIHSRTDRLIKNELGYQFPLMEKVVDMYGGLTSTKKDKSVRVGSQLLAHLCQGKEQFYIQYLISHYINENILTWTYDGLCLELDKKAVKQTTNCLVSACHVPLDCQPISA